MRRGFRAAAAAVVSATLLAVAAAAQQPPGGAVDAGPAVATGGAQVPPEAVGRVARELNCPLCQGYNLQDCPLQVCEQMRDLIRTQLAAGMSDEQIIAGFVDEYGPQVLNAPPRGGWYLAAWLLPAVAVVAGALWATALVVRSRRVAPGVPGPADRELAARLEALARERDE